MLFGTILTLFPTELVVWDTLHTPTLTCQCADTRPQVLRRLIGGSSTRLLTSFYSWGVDLQFCFVSPTLLPYICIIGRNGFAISGIQLHPIIWHPQLSRHSIFVSSVIEILYCNADRPDPVPPPREWNMKTPCRLSQPSDILLILLTWSNIGNGNNVHSCLPRLPPAQPL